MYRQEPMAYRDLLFLDKNLRRCNRRRSDNICYFLADPNLRNSGAKYIRSYGLRVLKPSNIRDVTQEAIEAAVPPNIKRRAWWIDTITIAYQLLWVNQLGRIFSILTVLPLIALGIGVLAIKIGAYRYRSYLAEWNQEVAHTLQEDLAREKHKNAEKSLIIEPDRQKQLQENIVHNEAIPNRVDIERVEQFIEQPVSNEVVMEALFAEVELPRTQPLQQPRSKSKEFLQQLIRNKLGNWPEHAEVEERVPNRMSSTSEKSRKSFDRSIERNPEIYADEPKGKNHANRSFHENSDELTEDFKKILETAKNRKLGINVEREFQEEPPEAPEQHTSFELNSQRLETEYSLDNERFSVRTSNTVKSMLTTTSFSRNHADIAYEFDIELETGPEIARIKRLNLSNRIVREQLEADQLKYEESKEANKVQLVHYIKASTKLQDKLQEIDKSIDELESTLYTPDDYYSVGQKGYSTRNKSIDDLLQLEIEVDGNELKIEVDKLVQECDESAQDPKDKYSSATKKQYLRYSSSKKKEKPRVETFEDLQNLYEARARYIAIWDRLQHESGKYEIEYKKSDLYSVHITHKLKLFEQEQRQQHLLDLQDDLAELFREHGIDNSKKDLADSLKKKKTEIDVTTQQNLIVQVKNPLEDELQRLAEQTSLAIVTQEEAIRKLTADFNITEQRTIERNESNKNELKDLENDYKRLKIELDQSEAERIEIQNLKIEVMIDEKNSARKILISKYSDKLTIIDKKIRHLMEQMDEIRPLMESRRMTVIPEINRYLEALKEPLTNAERTLERIKSELSTQQQLIKEHYAQIEARIKESALLKNSSLEKIKTLNAEIDRISAIPGHLQVKDFIIEKLTTAYDRKKLFFLKRPESEILFPDHSALTILFYDLEKPLVFDIERTYRDKVLSANEIEYLRGKLKFSPDDVIDASILKTYLLETLKKGMDAALEEPILKQLIEERLEKQVLNEIKKSERASIKSPGPYMMAHMEKKVEWLNNMAAEQNRALANEQQKAINWFEQIGDSKRDGQLSPEITNILEEILKLHSTTTKKPSPETIAWKVEEITTVLSELDKSCDNSIRLINRFMLYKQYQLFLQSHINHIKDYNIPVEHFSLNKMTAENIKYLYRSIYKRSCAQLVRLIIQSYNRPEIVDLYSTYQIIIEGHNKMDILINSERIEENVSISDVDRMTNIYRTMISQITNEISKLTNKISELSLAESKIPVKQSITTTSSSKKSIGNSLFGFIN